MNDWMQTRGGMQTMARLLDALETIAAAATASAAAQERQVALLAEMLRLQESKGGQGPLNG